MSVINFNRKTQKQQLLDLIEEFDFSNGAAVLYLDADFTDIEGKFSVVSTYESFGLKEALAAESIANFIRNNVYYVENE